MLFQQLLNMGHQKLKSKGVKQISAQHLRILKIKANHHNKIISLLDFQKKMLGSAGPQVFIFGRQDKSSSRQKEIFKN